MLYTKIKPQSFPDSGEDFQEVFLRCTDMAAIVFSCVELFAQIDNTLSSEGHVESDENRSSSFREEDI